jgi:hypothetical protein
MTRVVCQGVHHDCASCGGQLMGLVPFQERLVPADAAAVWRGSKAGTAMGECPFCAGKLRTPGAVAGAAGIAVCRRCEQVWVPKTATGWMSEHAERPEPSPPGTLRTHPDECATCGAPFSPDPEGRCRYCHQNLVVEPVVVALPHLLTTEEPSVGAVAGAVVESIIDLFTGGA